jgi:glycosyltransferase EpsH
MPYLAPCLDALLGQTLADLEICAVDDGSTDGSAALLADYAAKDARLKMRILPENRGVSAARNAGLALAQGDYVGFCDADDLAEPCLYAALLEAAESARAQVAFCAVVKDMPGRSITVPLPWPDGTVMDAAAIRDTLVPAMIALPADGEELPVSGYTPRNLFARALLAGRAFHPDIHYAEDLLFIVDALLAAQTAVVVAAPLYRYRFHGASVTQRYSPHVPASLYASQRALADALAAHGLLPALQARLDIRARRSALGAVINLCLPGTPYAPLARTRAIRAYIAAPQVRALFAPVRLRALPPKLALKYCLIRHRLATPLMLLFSYLYRTR